MEAAMKNILEAQENFAFKSITGNRRFDLATQSFQETKLPNLKKINVKFLLAKAFK